MVPADLALERPTPIDEVPDDRTHQEERDCASGISDHAVGRVAESVPGHRQSEGARGRQEAAPDAEPHSAESDRHDKEEQGCVGHVVTNEKQGRPHGQKPIGA